jgi:uncharacterized repeat protein (TIGR03803 family)
MKKSTLLFSACLFLLFTTIPLQIQSQPLLWGMTSADGNNSGGTIINYTGGDTSINNAFNLPSAYLTRLLNSSLTEAKNAKFYAFNTNDGAQLGSIFKSDTSGNYTTMVYLDSSTGIQPFGSLLSAGNGLLYALTPYGGLNNSGTIISYAPDSNYVTKLIDLPLSANPFGSLIQGANGILYGMTQNDGTNSSGTIFQYNISTATYSVLYNLPFNSVPQGSLLEVGSDTLYGMVSSGSGGVFQYVISTGTYTIAINFNYAVGDGALICASNGQLYGLTSYGGNAGSGNIFSYNIGSLTYTDLYDFQNTPDGANPLGDLYQASDSMLYGMTSAGGANGTGTIFQYNINNGIYTQFVNLSVTTGDIPEYGHFTEYVGIPALTAPDSQTVCTGTIVTFKALSNAIFTLIEWQVSTDGGNTYNNIPGANDTIYSFIAQASQNNDLYRAMFTNITGAYATAAATLTVLSHCPQLIACTIRGGAYAAGTIIRYTGGLNSLSGTFNFPEYNNYPNSGPRSNPTEAPNSKLYGLDASSGLNNLGSIYEYDYNSNSYALKVSFDSAMGLYPSGQLLLANNGLMYGLAGGQELNFNDGGGLYGGGTLFSYVPGSYSITILVNLPAHADPFGSLMQASDGKLYGMTSSNGTYLSGTLFQYDISTDSFTELYSFMSGDPLATLLEAGRDTLYGEADDSLFRYVISSHTFTTLYGFPGHVNSDFCTPIRASDGKLYGIAAYTPPTGGNIYSYDIGSGVYTDLHDFGSGNDGLYPMGDLYQASDGMLYGYTFTGGFNYYGTIFRYDIGTSTYTKMVDLNSATGFGPDYGHFIEYMTPPVINTQPSDYIACAGSTTTFTASASATYLTVQWQVSTDSGAIFTNIPGATDTNYSFISGSSQNGYQYRAVFVNVMVSDTSTVAILTVNPPVIDTITAFICQGDSVAFGLQHYYHSGAYTDTFSTSYGCDSIVTLHLTVSATAYTRLYDTICQGASVSLGSHSYIQAGVYTDTFASSHGCDSIVTLALTVYPTVMNSLYDTICHGSSVVLGSYSYTQAGVYPDTFSTLYGCDSIVTLYLTVSPNPSVDLYDTLVTGGTISIAGRTYSQSGTYADTLMSAHGCDSVITLHLLVESQATFAQLFDTICQGFSVTLGGHSYSVSGTYLDTISGTLADTIISLHLVVNQGLLVNTTDTICQGSSVTVGMHTYTQTGIYVDTLASVYGCDSVHSLSLTVLDSSNLTVSITLSRGPIAAGMETDTFTATSTGCTDPYYSWFNDIVPLGVHDPILILTQSTSGADSISCNVFCNNMCIADANASSNAININGISQISFIQGVNIYPNPTPGSINMEINTSAMADQDARISIIDMVGQTIQTEQLTLHAGYNKSVINISEGSASGVYIIQLTAAGQSAYYRIVLDR